MCSKVCSHTHQPHQPHHIHHTHLSKPQSPDCYHTSMTSKEDINASIIQLLTKSKTDEEIKQLIKGFILKINQENGSKYKYSINLFNVVKYMVELLSKFNPCIIDRMRTMSENDGHQFPHDDCYCVYHDGDTLLMHLFMCAIVVGAEMLQNGVSIKEKYKKTKVSKIVMNMLIALTHDIGKFDCAVLFKERKFVGFPFHGQASASFLLNIWDEKRMCKMGIDRETWYSVCLVSNFHMDFYSSKQGSENHQKIMSLGRWMAFDIVEELSVLFLGDNLAKFTPPEIKGRKFSSNQELVEHKSYFHDTISKSIKLDELKSILEVDCNGVLVLAVNGSQIGERVPLPAEITSHKNIVIVNKVDEGTKQRINDNLQDGKIVIVNVPEIILKTFTDFLPDESYLTFNLVFSNGFDSSLNPLPAIINASKSDIGRDLKSYCSKYIKKSYAHASIPYDGESLNYFKTVIGL